MAVDKSLGITPEMRKKLNVSMALALIGKLKSDGKITEHDYSRVKMNAQKMIGTINV